jgi:UDP-glucose-4-epimerase GalE
MRVLVTGGAGYIGSHTVRALGAAGHQVLVFDDLREGHRAAVGGVPLVKGDVRDARAVGRALRAARARAVIHFASLCYVGESVSDPRAYYDNNVLGGLALADAAVRHGAVGIIFSSSAAVYGVPEKNPIPESHPLRPINPYGRTKAVVEGILEDYRRAYGLGYVALRYFNAAGADPAGDIGEDHDPETHLVPRALMAAAGRLPRVGIFGTDYPTPDGTCVRDYVHVCDLADAHVRAMERLRAGEGTAYNVGTGRGASIREVIAAVEAVTGRRVPTRVERRRPGDPPALVASPARIRRELGWRPRFTRLRDIVATAWNWTRKHPAGFAERGRTPNRP